MDAASTCPICGCVLPGRARRVTVRVGEHHIALGQGCHSGRDPLALALLEATGISFIAAGRLALGRFWVRLPRSAQQFLVAYDTGDRLTPFSFDLDLPANVRV